jgi:hypothetical protein
VIADADMLRLISFIVGRVPWKTKSERQAVQYQRLIAHPGEISRREKAAI